MANNILEKVDIQEINVINRQANIKLRKNIRPSKKKKIEANNRKLESKFYYYCFVLERGICHLLYIFLYNIYNIN